MSDFRRFYSYGLEHAVHLEELERLATGSRNLHIKSPKKKGAIRHRVALTLMTLAERFDRAGMAHDNKVRGAFS